MTKVDILYKKILMEKPTEFRDSNTARITMLSIGLSQTESNIGEKTKRPTGFLSPADYRIFQATETERIKNAIESAYIQV